MPIMIEILIQSVIAFIVLFILARLMGKRQVAQLTYFDYIVGITIGNIAAAWSLDDVRSLHAIISLLVWTVFPLVLAFIQRKSYRARILFDGSPTVIVRDGKVLEANLKKVGLDADELTLLLREKDSFKLSDVEYAIFETNGSLSVMKKTELQPLTPKDTGISSVPEHEPRILIIDGHVMEKSLQSSGYTKEWLFGEILAQGASDFRDVFLAQVDSNGSVYVDLYRDRLKEPQIKQKPLCAASLKKIQSDIEGFALQTENQHAKKMYVDSAEQLKTIVSSMAPYLKE